MQPKQTNVMIDLETLSLKRNAAILSIGAVRFNDLSAEIEDEFYMVIDIDSACQNRHIDPQTLKWWMEQSIEAREEVFGGCTGMVDALTSLSNFIKSVDGTKVWSNGSVFDIVVLEDCYDQYDIHVPWKYNNIRDCRTVEDLGSISRHVFKRDGVHHNALDDAKFQVKYISANIRNILTGEMR